LLEDILLNKEFFKPSEFESNFWILEWRKMFDFKRTKMEPELAISLLLEKIELWKALTEEDYENIEELCISN
jgi:myosin-crossreactive antigen